MSSVRLDTEFIGPCTVWKCFSRGERFDLMLVSGIRQQSQGTQECRRQNPLWAGTWRAPRNVLVGSPWVSTSRHQRHMEPLFLGLEASCDPGQPYEGFKQKSHAFHTAAHC